MAAFPGPGPAPRQAQGRPERSRRTAEAGHYVQIRGGRGVLAAQRGTPQAPRTGLTVSVLDPSRHAVPGATVTIRDDSGRVVALTPTAADGIVRAGDITAGTFAIEVAAP